MKYKFLILFISICFVLPSQNKYTKLVFNHLCQEEFIKKLNTHQIVKDNQGFLWLATDNGLYKYDGRTYKVFKHNINDTNSFESNKITSIIKDEEGLLWLGVDGAGLYQFNPITEKAVLYRNTFKSILTKRVEFLNQDKNGNIYVSTYGGGLNIFNKKTKKFKSLYPSEKDSTTLAYSIVNNVIIEDDGKVWICCKMKSLDLYDPKTEKVTHYNPFKGVPGDHYYSRIAKYKNESIYLSSSEGLFEFSIKERKFIMHTNDEKDKNSIFSSNVRNVYVSSNNQIYLSHVDGSLDIFNHDTKKAIHYSHNAEDKYSLCRSNLIESYYEDENGFLYLCNNNAGIDVIYPKAINADYFVNDPNNKNSLIRDDVMCLFLEGENKLWIGAYGAGASCLNLNTGVFKNYYWVENDKNSISNGLIYSFHISKDGYMWFCTENGLNKIDLRTDKVVGKYFTSDNESKGEKYLRTNRTSKIYEDEKGNFWVSLIGGGLMYFNPKTEDFTRYKYKEDDTLTIGDNRIFDMTYDKINHILWLATYSGGLSAFDVDTKKTTRYQYKKSNVNSISNDFCWSVKIDPRTNILWIPTDGGLNAIDLKTLPKNRTKAKFFHLTQNEGLPADQVYGAVPDSKGRIWLGVGSSICCYLPPKRLMGQLNDKEYPNGLVKVYNKSHGLPISNTSTMVYSKYTNRLFFGAIGFCSFNPDAILKHKEVAPVYITSISLFDTIIQSDTSAYIIKSLDLNYNQNSISFTFSSPDFYFPENVKFAYRLEGFDKKWTKAGSKNSAEYTNLSPGQYTFRVKVYNSDGYSSDTDAIVYIHIRPPFWQTAWFYILVILIVIGFGYLFVKWREKSLLKENEKLENSVALRTQELSQEKEIVMQQRDLIKEKQKEIIDSINYARRIQYTLLAHEQFLKDNLLEHFVYFKPKDIVSGDFYWATKRNNKFYLAVCDSTGHGVPGAFMSLLNIGFLNEAINEKGIEKPNEVLNFVRQKLIHTINKEGHQDGFDGILMCFDYEKDSITYSAANNTPVIIQNGNIVQLESDRMPVGIGARQEDFKLYSVPKNKGEIIYLYTDGYADQFGGTKGKKLKYKVLNQLLLEASHKPLTEQAQLLKESFEVWRGDLEQVDDVCVIGIKF